jgi:PAS domain S-box-containing protein
MILDAIRDRRVAHLIWRLPTAPFPYPALLRDVRGLFLALAGGFACLGASGIILWHMVQPQDAALGLMLFFFIGGAVVSTVAGLAQASRLRRTDSEAQRRETMMRLAVESAALGMFEIDFLNGSEECNAVERVMFGFAPDVKVAFSDLVALVHEADRAARLAAMQVAVNPDGDGVYKTRFRIRRANDGAVRWIATSGKVFFRRREMTYLIGVSGDVTDDVDTERLLQEKTGLAERLTGLATTLPGPIFTLRMRADGSSYLPYAAPKIEDLTGFGPEELALGTEVVFERVHVDDLTPVRASVALAVEQCAPWRVIFRYHHLVKGLIWIQSEAAPQFLGEGDTVWHGYLKDITKRQNDAAALEASEERLRAVFDGADDAIFTVDPGGDITSLNAAGQLMFGYRAEDIIGARIESLLAGPAGLWSDAMGEIASPRLKKEIEGRRRDGTLFPISVTLSEIRTSEAQVFVGFARNLTEQRRIEARMDLMIDARLATLETMAAGLAHEVNQPLSASATFLKVARRMLDAPQDVGTGPSVQQVLEKAAAQLMRAGRIMTRVREFSTRGEPDKTFQNLHGLLTSVTRALSEDSRFSEFRLKLLLEAENDRVIVDRLQISQVLINLLHNAVRAMQDAPSRDIVVATAVEGQCEIRVRIIDSGIGMSEETRKNLFEPFKTVKPSGMGVGLSISHGIIDAHFGKIWAEPNPCGGVIFNFTLPLVEQKSS